MNTFVKSDITEQVMTVVCTFYAVTHGCNSGTYILCTCVRSSLNFRKKNTWQRKLFLILKILI